MDCSREKNYKAATNDQILQLLRPGRINPIGLDGRSREVKKAKTQVWPENRHQQTLDNGRKFLFQVDGYSDRYIKHEKYKIRTRNITSKWWRIKTSGLKMLKI